MLLWGDRIEAAQQGEPGKVEQARQHLGLAVDKNAAGTPRKAVAGRFI